MHRRGHVELDERESDEVEERRLPPPHVVFETVRQEGAAELERSASALLCSGLAAGLSMAFSLIATAVLHARLPAAPWRPLVEGLGYSVGFLIVVLGRQQLFTENTLTPVLPFLVSPQPRMLRALGRLWLLVLVANLAGCAIIAFTLATAPVFPAEISHALRAVAHHAVDATPLATFWRSIFAGWLIALMVWLLPASQGGARPAIVTLLTYMIAICGFSHIVAGSVDALYEVFRGDVTAGTFLGTFFVPTLCGNVLGGVLLVSLLSFGQVFADHVKTGAGAPPARARRKRG